MRAAICDGLRPISPAMSAARPAVCGEAMLVPFTPRMKLPVLQTWTCTENFEHAAQTGAAFPPGAATLTAERPKLLYGASASTFVRNVYAPFTRGPRAV